MPDRFNRSPVAIYSATTPAALITAAHLAISPGSQAASSLGELCAKVMPCAATAFDAASVRSAVENVAANALDALQERGGGGVLALRAVQRNGTVELLVEDNGPGIPEGVRASLFAPFASGNSGTGLGLAIARALARAGGGDLTCERSVPGHTAFRFTFRPA